MLSISGCQCRLLSDNSSSMNYCGDTREHCGSGCQPSFGTCHETATNDLQEQPQPESDSQLGTAGSVVSIAGSASLLSGSSLPKYVEDSSEKSTQVSMFSAERTGTTSYSTGDHDDSHTQGSAYIKTFKGKGLVSSEGWPSKSRWLSFEEFWESNLETMEHSCQNWNASWAQNSDTEIDTIKSSIEELATETKLDKTFIAAIMMQESNGCTRVHTTYNSHPNPGLFQSHDGTGSCNDKPSGPCPQAEIFQMVRDGAGGTSQGDGLKQCLEKSKNNANVVNDEATYYYQAARRYNSGSLAPDGDLGRKGATPCYCSDVANRLIGWSKGISGCTTEAILQP
jgi:hypothetical protein